MTQNTRIVLYQFEQLITALQANDHDLFKRWLYGGVEDLRKSAVTDLLLDWLDRLSSGSTVKGSWRGTWPLATCPFKGIDTIGISSRG